MEALRIVYKEFDHAALIENPTLLQELARFYCSIWMKDPNFGEYKKCPVCDKYYNEDQVEKDGVTTCSGVTSPHPTVDLIAAWEPEKVADEELLGNTTQYGDNFFGIYALDEDSGKIVGFTWGWLESAEKIKEKWGVLIVQKLGGIDSTYYSEIAVDPSPTYRGKGIGKTLCSMLTMWMASAYPDLPSFLRTHKDSFAKKMFAEVGYCYFAKDPQHGDGRIMMKVSKGSKLVP